MYAPLPQHMLVVVKPPAFFVEIGLAQPGEYWTLHKAVYGLRVSPRQWGLYRDETLSKINWSVGTKNYHLVQCSTDTQVWKIVESTKPTEVLGMIIVYVDDLLLLAPIDEIRDGLVKVLRDTWNMKPPAELTKTNSLTFLGVELHLTDTGVTLTQQRFTQELLEKRGMQTCNGIQAITMDRPPETPSPPSPQTLKNCRVLRGSLTGYRRVRGRICHILPHCSHRR